MKNSIKYKIIEPSKLDKIQKKELKQSIVYVLNNAWAEFPEKFIESHILRSPYMSIAIYNNKIVGFCSVSQKKINYKKIFYIEFSIVLREFQKNGVGTKLTFLALRRVILKNILFLPLYGVDIMFITPNIRVLASSVKYSNFIYPNPFLANQENGSIIASDKETYKMAQRLIKTSDNPDRMIDREGLVLHDSYKDTPWLIYANEKIPWHRDELINKFAKRYLGYGKSEDKEFIVRMRVSLLSLIKYLIKFEWISR